jgi:hypothetical protein
MNFTAEQRENLSSEEKICLYGLLHGSESPGTMLLAFAPFSRSCPNGLTHGAGDRPLSSRTRKGLQSERYRIFNPIATHLEAKAVLAELSRYAADAVLSRTVGLNEDEIQATRNRVVWTRVLQPGPTLAIDGTMVK